MAIFEFKGADGRVVEVRAPDQETAIAAYRQFTPPPAPMGQEQPQTSRLAPQPGAVSPPVIEGDTIVPPPPANGWNYEETGQVGPSLKSSMYRAGKVASDLMGAGAAGVSRGVTGMADLPGMVTGGLGNLALSGMERTGLISPGVAQGGRDAFAAMPMGDGSLIADAASAVTNGGSEYRGQTLAGQYAGTVGEFLPGALAGGGGIASNLMRYGVVPGLASEAAGQWTAGTKLEPWARMGAAISAPFAISGAENAIHGAKQAYTRHSTAQQVGDALGIDRRAGSLLADMVAMDDPQRMRQALVRAGDDAMLADAGPTLQGALDAAIQSPGEGARRALSRIDERSVTAGQRLRGELDRVLTANTVGQPSARQFTDAASMQGDLRQATASARRQVYDRAFAQAIDYTSDAGRQLENLQGRIPARAISEANELMRVRGEQSRQILAQLDDAGNVIGFERLPDVRQWDYIKQGLRQMAKSGDGQGALGGQTPKGSSYEALSNDIRRALGEAVPEYDDATRIAGDVISEIDAIKTGSTILQPGVTRAEVERTLDGMSRAEVSAVKRGLRQHIDDTLANVRAVATDPNVDARQAHKAMTDLSSQASRDKMRMLLGNDWPSVERALDSASSALGLRARVATNSRTFGRQQFGEMLDEGTVPGALRRGEPITTARNTWQRMTGATPSQVSRARAGVRNQIVDALTRSGASGILDTIEQANVLRALAASGRQSALPAASGISAIVAALAAQYDSRTQPSLAGK